MFSPEIQQTDVVPPEVLQMKDRTLEFLKVRLSEMTYPGYPTKRLSVNLSDYQVMSEIYGGNLYLPSGPWSTDADKLLPAAEIKQIWDRGLRTDHLGRPLHPWVKEMLTDPGLGVVTGKGFYWRWGPNQTADTIAVAKDSGAILLIKRADTHQWALPGGFVDLGEQPLQTAMRELTEETGVEVDHATRYDQVYSGPVADIRVTANAWAETTAFIAQFPYEVPWQILDPSEIEAIQWSPPDRVLSDLSFGSHSLLAELAIKQVYR